MIILYEELHYNSITWVTLTLTCNNSRPFSGYISMSPTDMTVLSILHIHTLPFSHVRFLASLPVTIQLSPITHQFNAFLKLKFDIMAQ